MDNTAELTPGQVIDSLAAMQDAFLQVRSLILERAGNATYTDKTDGSPVTKTDVEVENIIQTIMAERSPGLPVYGEEGGYANDLQGNFWLVDPIDGTSSFVKNIPVFTSMAVLVQNGVATASVIYNPTRNDMYVAQIGNGALKNGTHLNLQAMSLSQIASCKQEFIESLNTMLEPQRITCGRGPVGIGHEMALVAEGSMAARFNLHAGGYTHDYAPGALLVQEAGGVIVPISESVYTYETRSFVACHPALESVMQQHMKMLRELEGDWPKRKN